MRPYGGLLYTGWILIGLGVLFYAASVAGAFWPNPTPWNDPGLYSVTVILVGFGLGTLMLRRSKLDPRAE